MISAAFVKGKKKANYMHISVGAGEFLVKAGTLYCLVLFFA